MGNHLPSENYYMKASVSWSDITSGVASFRYYNDGFIFNNKGNSIFFESKRDKFALLSYCNSSVFSIILKAVNPTLTLSVGSLAILPEPPIEAYIAQDLVKKNLAFSKADWDSYETSWDFTILPLLQPDHHQPTLKATYTKLCSYWKNMTIEMQRLEEENNRTFIEAYGLQDELTPDVPLSEITLTCNPHYRYDANKSEEELETLLLTDTIKELSSYAIGCMMGRYSLDRPGLIYAHSGNKNFEDIYYRKDAKTKRNIRQDNRRDRIFYYFCSSCLSC